MPFKLSQQFAQLNFSQKIAQSTKTMLAISAISVSGFAITGCANFEQNMKDVVQVAGEMAQQGNGQAGSGAGLSNSTIISGLKEALAKGTTTAVNQLGQNNGYWANTLVKIAMPDELEKLSKNLRRFGQGQLVDDFELAMNRAAEKAVPEAANILGNAVRNMTFADARSILQGDDLAATSFFKRTTEQSLFQRFYPIVQNATNQTGVTQAYKDLVAQAGPLAALINIDANSLDQYVTDQALEGLFTVIGQQEQAIRNNPAERTTAILREVFGR